METLINITLLSILGVTALAILLTHQLFAAVMLTGLYSVVAAALFVTLDAVDVAFTEAAVGAGIATILMLGTLALTTTRKEPLGRVPWAALAVVLLTGAALVYGTFDMPHFADPAGPAHHHVAPYYIERAGVETGVPNMVTAVLASYRGYDTLGEVVVIFTAGIGVLALMGRGRRREGPAAPESTPSD